MATTAKKLLEKAASQIGVKENPPGSNIIKYWTWYKEKTGLNLQGAPWCAAFVTWCLGTLGQWKVTKDEGRFRYCPSLVNWGKEKREWIDRSKTPKPGDIVLFANKGVACHVGFVEKVLSGGNLQTIEGNTSVASNDNGGSVMRRIRGLGVVGSSWYVLGYIRPKYSKEVELQPVEVPKATYTKGRYKVTASKLNVRTRPKTGSDSKILKKSQLTPNGQKNANSDGTLKKGTVMDVSEVKTDSDKNPWGKIPSGWVCLEFKGKTRVKKM